MSLAQAFAKLPEDRRPDASAWWDRADGFARLTLRLDLPIVYGRRFVMPLLAALFSAMGIFGGYLVGVHPHDILSVLQPKIVECESAPPENIATKFASLPTRLEVANRFSSSVWSW